MPKQLDTPKASGPPAIHFDLEGNDVVVGLVDVGEYQQRNFDTGDLETWPDGGPKMGKVVTGLVISTNGGLVTIDDNERAAIPGDLVTFWCEGGKHFTYRDAVKAAKGITQGDLMHWKYVRQEPPKKKGHNGLKVYEAKIRHPEAKDGDIVDRCVEAYNRLHSTTLDDADPTYDEDPPF